MHIQEDRKILKTIWYQMHKWMCRVLWHDGILHDILEGRMLGNTRKKMDSAGRRLIRKKNYGDLKKQLMIGVSGEQ